MLATGAKSDKRFFLRFGLTLFPRAQHT